MPAILIAPSGAQRPERGQRLFPPPESRSSSLTPTSGAHTSGPIPLLSERCPTPSAFLSFISAPLEQTENGRRHPAPRIVRPASHPRPRQFSPPPPPPYVRRTDARRTPSHLDSPCPKAGSIHGGSIRPVGTQLPRGRLRARALRRPPHGVPPRRQWDLRTRSTRTASKATESFWRAGSEIECSARGGTSYWRGIERGGLDGV